MNLKTLKGAFITETKLLTAVQVAELLGVAKRTVWRLRDSGAIPAPVRLGGAVVFSDR
ncbi:MAG: helix-turn-helix domain-containing protein [Candidatus Hydrogenedens sp.]|nr:helix-turn-helix domain-containing protein [Candidatus Hydrogenedens sp.]